MLNKTQQSQAFACLTWHWSGCEGKGIGLRCKMVSHRSTLTLSRKHCLTLEIIREFDRELKIPVDKRRPTLPTLIAALFYDLSTDKEIKIPSIGEKRERELRSGVIMIAISYS